MWNKLHLSIVLGYFSNLSTICDFPKFPSAKWISHHDIKWLEDHIKSTLRKELRQMFVVPKLNKFHEAKTRINKSHLLQAFLSFLLQLLHHKTDLTVARPVKDRLDNLENELRFLLTILGDCDDELEATFPNILPEFEALANQAGSYVHDLFFSDESEQWKRFDAIREQTGLLRHKLKLPIMKRFPAILKQAGRLRHKLQLCISIPAYTTPTTSTVGSMLILNTLVDDLEDLLKREDDRIADVKFEAELLLHELKTILSVSDNKLKAVFPNILPELEALANEAGSYVHDLFFRCETEEMKRLVAVLNQADLLKAKLQSYIRIPAYTTPTTSIVDSMLILNTLVDDLEDLLKREDDEIADVKSEAEFLHRDLKTILSVSDDKLEAAFPDLLPEFEALANEAGSYVHDLFSRCETEKMKRLVAVLNQADLLKAKLQSSISIQAYTTPTTSVVGSMLILNTLVDDLEDLLTREDDRIADVKDQVKLLHNELLLSYSSVKDMRSPQPSEIEELKEPLMCIGGIAHHVEYLITSFMVKDAPLWYVIDRLADLHRRIEPIRTELQIVTQKCKFGGLKVEEEPLQSRRYTEANDVTVGSEDKMMDILDQLVGGGTQSLQIISIVGMPGLGKTTLAKKLYKHPLVNYTFVKLSWCVVSQTYEICGILSTILSQLESKFSNSDMQETSLVEHIYKTLKGRRYLIVLDDIWDPNILDKLLRCFPEDANGSRILFTSRNKDMAPHNCIMHELPFLTDEQCWELLEKKAFGGRTCPPQLQEIGKKIAAKCCGLPLTVVVIAGVLSTVDEKESRWEEVGGSLTSYTDNSVMQILKLSYKHLPDHLKPCFLYFGEFKEDEAISVGNLKRLWVAEGFICKEKGKSDENIAGEYLMELIDRSLLMIVKRSYDGRGVKTCVVHDLLRDMCLKISKEESFLKFLDNEYTIFEKDHRVRGFGKCATLSYCQHVRSFVGNRLTRSSSFYVRDMRLLRVLHFGDLYECSVFGFNYLVNLRSLVTHDVPPWIDMLQNLEYLRVDSSTTYPLPAYIVKMKRLKYIRTCSADYDFDWKKDQTNNLEYISKVYIYDLRSEELLKCSPHLRKLKCIYDPKQEVDKRRHPRFDLCYLNQLDSLSLSGYLRKKDFGFPPNIRKLTLEGSGLLPEMSTIGRLKFLEVLKLERVDFMGNRWDTRDGEFQELRFLQLASFWLSEWNVASNEHFPKLHQLILDCYHLREIPSEIGEISTLELIEIKGGSESLVESAKRIEEEQRDMGNEDLRVIISSRW